MTNKPKARARKPGKRLTAVKTALAALSMGLTIGGWGILASGNAQAYPIDDDPTPVVATVASAPTATVTTLPTGTATAQPQPSVTTTATTQPTATATAQATATATAQPTTTATASATAKTTTAPQPVTRTRSSK